MDFRQFLLLLTPNMHAYLNNSTTCKRFQHRKITLFFNPEEGNFLTTRVINVLGEIVHFFPQSRMYINAYILTHLCMPGTEYKPIKAHYLSKLFKNGKKQPITYVIINDNGFLLQGGNPKSSYSNI